MFRDLLAPKRFDRPSVLEDFPGTLEDSRETFEERWLPSGIGTDNRRDVSCSDPVDLHTLEDRFGPYQSAGLPL